ncbi:polyhydroxyalkanoic acid system family protein [Ramlibacter sp. USB13]|uniref:Polyhydroxyalkanoic acid system family protein n=1 Tax=Ramlibacter cellulosilyticus TaxID=2764187 RepID=A0A923MTH1_9BURK|nr:polyhydroxyalkanoic acid system family protein [Ramlibacter cellulosilyticus]
MADIRIVREHALGLEQARKLAWRWAEVAEKKLDMECTYEEGKTHDTVRFERPGASGELHVGKDKFQLHAKLGLLLGVFKGKIESEIVKNLDQLLEQEDPLHAFEQGLAKHEAKKAAKHAKPHAEGHKPAGKTAAKAAPRKHK